jgi:hypothetical protein
LAETGGYTSGEALCQAVGSIAQMLPEHLAERIERLESRLEELLTSPPLEYERRNFPETPGVYLFALRARRDRSRGAHNIV